MMNICGERTWPLTFLTLLGHTLKTVGIAYVFVLVLEYPAGVENKVDDADGEGGAGYDVGVTRTYTFQ